MPTRPLYHSDLSRTEWGGKEIRGTKICGSRQGQFNKAKEKAVAEVKKNKRIIRYFPSPGDVQPLPGK